VTSIAVRVPASSANLGPGFDVLGMALDLPADVGTGDPPPGARAADEHHPAMIAFRDLGGTGALWVRTSIPMSRGLGYSGAVRVGGAAVAAIQRADDRDAADVVRGTDVLEVAARLEGHGDNALASQRGGVTVYDHERPVELRLAFDPEPVVVAWSPIDVTASTARSRAALPATVDRADATFNVARVAMLVAAFERGDVDLLRGAMDDRLHQAARLGALPGSADALAAGVEAGAWAGWLSGSGPTVAFLCAPADASRLAGALPPGGQVRTVRIDKLGVRPIDPEPRNSSAAVR
jgi:homoserine kinase